MSMYVDSLVIRRWKTTNGNIHDSSVAHYMVDSVKDYSYILGDWAYDTSGIYDYVVENTHTVPVIDTNKRRGIISNKLKVNRKVKIKGRWTTLDSLPLNYEDSEIVRISGNIYNVCETVGRIKGIGTVKIVISEGKNGIRYYVTNMIGWDLMKIMETYLRRWDIEVLHMDLKQDGLGHISLRKLCKTELYLRLIVTGRVLLEISSIRSVNNYMKMDGRVGIRKRWISFEFLESLFCGFEKYGYRFLQTLKKYITDPYRSARGFLSDHVNLHKGGAI